MVLEDGTKGRLFSEGVNYHKGINATVSLNVPPHKAYNAGGMGALINGVSGSNTRFGDKEWLGFWGDDLEIVITFKEPTEISKVSTRFFNANGQWLYTPQHLAGQVLTTDGEIVASKNQIKHSEGQTLIDAGLVFTAPNKIIATSLTLLVPNYGLIPEGLQGSGNKAWTFIDEIIIE